MSITFPSQRSFADRNRSLASCPCVCGSFFFLLFFPSPYYAAISSPRVFLLRPTRTCKFTYKSPQRHGAQRTTMRTSRSGGVVGHHVCLTHRRSPVRARVRSFQPFRARVLFRRGSEFVFFSIFFCLPLLPTNHLRNRVCFSQISHN